MEFGRSYRGLGRILLGLLVLAISSSVLYGSEPDPLRFQDEIQKDIQSWGDNLKDPITTLFWLLVTLDFAWTCIQLALKAGGLEDFVGIFIKKIFFYGIGVFLLLNGTDYAFAIVDSFIRLAGIAAGVSTENPVEGIWDYTFQAIDDMYRDVSVWSNPVRTFVNGLAILGMGLLGAYISVVLILAYCEGYIVISLAFVFLAFGGSGFTSDYGKKYLHFAILAGTRLFTIIVLAYLGIEILKEWSWTFKSPEASRIISGLAGFAIFAVLVQKIPDVVVNVLSGGGLSGASQSIGAQAVKMATVGTAAAVTGGIAATGAAANLAKAEGATGALGIAGGTAKNFAKAFGKDMKGSFTPKSLELNAQPGMGHRMALRMGHQESALGRGGDEEGNSISAGEGNAPSTGSVSGNDQGGDQTGSDGAEVADGGGSDSAERNPLEQSRFDPTGDNMGGTGGTAAPAAPQVRNSGGAGSGLGSDFTPPVGSTVKADSGNAVGGTGFDPTGDNMGTSKGDSSGQISNAGGSAAPAAPQIKNSGAGTGAPSAPASGFTPPVGTTVAADPTNSVGGNQMQNTPFDPTGDNMQKSDRMEKIRREMESFRPKKI